MRKAFVSIIVAGLYLVAVQPLSAQDEAHAIIEKAIKAHGGAEKLSQVKATQTKAKGTLEIMGMSVDITEEAMLQMPGQLKESLQLNINGMQISVTTGFNGKKGWISAGGMVMDMDDKLVKEVQEALYLANMNGFTALKDKTYKVAPLGESKVNDRPVLGVKISSEGHRDVNFYFDKSTGLLAKIEHRALDYQAMQEVDEERFLLDYQEIDGLKVPKKAKVTRDGKKYLELEITEYKRVDKIDASEFARP